VPDSVDEIDLPRRPLPHRVRRAFTRARVRERRSERSLGGQLATLAVVGLAGLMATVGALTARGGDLRGGRNSDLVGLVSSQANDSRALRSQLAQLRREVDELSTQDAGDPTLMSELENAAAVSGSTPVKGPAVKVVLTDAPLDVKPEGVSDDLLVVHQQDIQMVVNTMWSSGAEAMTIQGRRVISTTGVKCVGNSVVLHGVPYAPPYEIVAIGDQQKILAALDSSPSVAIYKQYVEAYKLGWKQSTLTEVTMPAYEGTTTLDHAKPPR